MSEGSGHTWLQAFAADAVKTDKLVDNPEHLKLLAAGLIGEAGSIIAELKKERRELEAYPAYRNRMLEEVGDFLWYFVRLLTLVDPDLITELQDVADAPVSSAETKLSAFLDLGTSVGDVVSRVNSSRVKDIRPVFREAWARLNEITQRAGVSLVDAAHANAAKTQSRWPESKQYWPLFDEPLPEEDQLPRRLRFEFRERTKGNQRTVVLRCNGLNFGDRLTDNIESPDGYRFHDVFHFAYVVYLGWSPVMRALLRCKRKSLPKADEAQDGARAGIIEEAISAIVFSRAKQLKFFDGLSHVDYDLLKTVQEFAQGFEVSNVPLWQWERAIIEGYNVFRALCANGGGHVTIDIANRALVYESPTS